jgi:hypothetical protein
LFYDGPLSERKLGRIETGFGTALPNPAQYKLVFDIIEDEAYESDKIATKRVLKGLRDEAIYLALDANRRVDVRMHLYEWLANSDPPTSAEDRLSKARERACRIIGPNFRVLKMVVR